MATTHGSNGTGLLPPPPFQQPPTMPGVTPTSTQNGFNAQTGTIIVPGTMAAPQQPAALAPTPAPPQALAPYVP